MDTMESVFARLQSASTFRGSDLEWKHLCGLNQALIAKNPSARCSLGCPKVRKAVEEKQVQSLATPDANFTLTPDGYHESLKVLLAAEEAHEHIDARKFDQKQRKVYQWEERSQPNPRRFYLDTGEKYQFKVNGLSKGQPKLVPGDAVILDDGQRSEQFEIDKTVGDLVVFKRPYRLCQEVKFTGEQMLNSAFDISFVHSGLIYERYIKNLSDTSKSGLVRGLLFGLEDSTKLGVSKIDLDSSAQPDLDTRLLKCNSRQRQAVENILAAKCRPNLYVLFGPPGTGKTFTLIETVIQIYVRNPQAFILVCSGSNNCANDLAAIIYKSGLVGKMRRLCSGLHHKGSEGTPNYLTADAGQAECARVVVTTNMMALKLGAEYDYVFVDEAGHSHVPETLLPVAKLKSDGCFILAGDPKQLGPVIKNYEVDKFGLGVSLLERKFLQENYARRGELGYDPVFITKLVESYRCDPGILNLCNKLFYDGELQCLGKTPPSILRMLKLNKPLVFARVDSEEDSPGGSTSRRNLAEAVACMNVLFNLYKMGLSPDQVGIITPYVLQRETILEKFKERLEREKALLNQRFRLTPAEVKEPTEVSTTPKTSGDSDIPHSLYEALGFLNLKDTTDDTAKETKSNKTKEPAIDWRCKVDTVDAFQGNEREVIIVSTVRTSDCNQIDKPGFLVNAKRFNVTISRAKWLVIVVGHQAVLNCSHFWRTFGSESCRMSI